jgi:hypothetical protein
MHASQINKQLQTFDSRASAQLNPPTWKQLCTHEPALYLELALETTLPHSQVTRLLMSNHLQGLLPSARLL